MNEVTKWDGILAALDAFRRLRVVVVGDVMLDRTLSGTISRISPEAPVPVLSVKAQRSTPGGAANVAMNLAELGASVCLFGVVGADAAGDELERSLLARGVRAGLLAVPGKPTIVKQRLVAQRQQLLRFDVEETAALGVDQEERLLAELRPELPRAHAVIVSDYAKGTLTERVLSAIAQSAADRLTVVDPKAQDLTRYRGHRFVTPNRAEFEAAYGIAIEDEAEITRRVCPDVARNGWEALVVTCGDRGVLLVRPDRIERIPGHPVEVFDVVGAGDTFISTFALARAAGLDASTSAAAANVAGSIAVGKIGTAQVRPDELRHRLEQLIGHAGRLSTRAQKRTDREGARRLAAEARARGARVVFTNGCFDLLHPGHVKILTEARAAGDLLIVGLNSDASVARLKGPGRPVVPEDDRATLLAAYDFVDAVVLFDEETPAALIEAVLPDVLVKGGDYAGAEVVGRELVESRGGQVLLVELLEGRSSTSVIERLRRA